MLNDPERAYLRANYPGLTVVELAAHLRCGGQVVSRTLREMGIPTRQAGWQPKLADEKRRAILAAWVAGKATNTITGELATSASTVKTVLRDAGIEWENRLARGEQSPSWRGGQVRLGQYVGIYVEQDDPARCMATRDGYVPAHRLVMARHLGRALEKHETVHHINGVRDDNRLENLQLRSGRHGKGVAVRCLDCGSANIEHVAI